MSRFYRFGLTGYPLEHSLSPNLHRAALEACGLQGEYQLFPIPPGEECFRSLSQLFDRLRSGELHGLNVTIPHKQAVIEHIDQLTPAARAIGAVNTIFSEGDRLVGDNTDAPGFLADLLRNFPYQGGPPPVACILGAGGSARAVAYALAQEGWRILLAARRLAQAQELIERLRHLATQPPGGLAQHFRALPLDIATISGEMLRLQVEEGAKIVIVNTTPVGMYPHVDGTPWSEEFPLPENAFVYDLVYNPAETRLVAHARRAGLEAANGSGMLVEQAALAFERWTGLEAPRQAMRLAMIDGG